MLRHCAPALVLLSCAAAASNAQIPLSSEAVGHTPPIPVVGPLDLSSGVDLPSFLKEGESATVQMSLLDASTPFQLLGILDVRIGVIPMIYADDAVSTFAKIDRTHAIPVPGSIALAAIGLLLTAFRSRRPR